MAKQPTSLGGLVKKGPSGPAAHAAPVAAPASPNYPINFKVPEEFDQRFRTYAVRHRMKLSELFMKAFDEYESNNP